MTLPVLILASGSPRRRQLLALTGWTFQVRPADIDESVRPGELPAPYVQRLAAEKAQLIAQTADAGQIILAADTTVADGSAILGKPANAAEARTMLQALRATDHWVHTGLAVYGPVGAPDAALHVDLCSTRVVMRDYSDVEIETYIATGDPFDKAGAYAIQHKEFNPVMRVEGCYACVVGLPLCRVVRLLSMFGLQPPQALTTDCRENDPSTCQIYPLLTAADSATERNV